MSLFLCHDPYATKYQLSLSVIRRIVGNPELLLGEGDRITLPTIPEARGGQMVEPQHLLLFVQEIKPSYISRDKDEQVLTLVVL